MYYYSKNYYNDKCSAVKKYIIASKHAKKMGIGLNAGHDLSLSNLRFFNRSVVDLLEVSIGHALISDSIYYGFENTIQMYKRLL